MEVDRKTVHSLVPRLCIGKTWELMKAYLERIGKLTSQIEEKLTNEQTNTTPQSNVAVKAAQCADYSQTWKNRAMTSEGCG